MYNIFCISLNGQNKYEKLNGGPSFLSLRTDADIYLGIQLVYIL